MGAIALAVLAVPPLSFAQLDPSAERAPSSLVPLAADEWTGVAASTGTEGPRARQAAFVLTMSGSSSFAFTAEDRIEGGCPTPALVDLEGSQTITWTTRPIRVSVFSQQLRTRTGVRTVPVFEATANGLHLSTDPRRGESFNLPLIAVFDRRISGVMADGTCEGTARVVNARGCGRTSARRYAIGLSPDVNRARTYEFRVVGYPDPYGRRCDVPRNNISDEPAPGLFPTTVTHTFGGTWSGFFSTPVGGTLTLRAAGRDEVGSRAVVTGTSAYRAKFVFRRVG